jgi:hypothetical protein
MINQNISFYIQWLMKIKKKNFRFFLLFIDAPDYFVLQTDGSIKQLF